VAKKENLPPPPKKEPESEPLPQLPPAEEDEAESEESEPDPERVARAARALCVDLVARFTRHEAERARRAARRGAKDFCAWLDEFYSIEKSDSLARQLAHGIELQLACAGLDGDSEEMARDLALVYVARSKSELQELPRTGLEEHVVKLVDTWVEVRPQELADRITAIRPREAIHG
jgi:hypothetical protein